MLVKLILVFFTAILSLSASAVQHKPLQHKEQYVDLHTIPAFVDAYKKWQHSASIGETMDALSVIWGISLRSNAYLDVCQKIAPHIPKPTKEARGHWAAGDIATMLLIANDHNAAKPWIGALRSYDRLQLPELYPLIAITPEINETKDLNQAKWVEYQQKAFKPDVAQAHMQMFQHIMQNKDQYTRDQLIVLMVQNDLIR